MWLNHDPLPRSFTIFSGFLHIRIVGSYFVLHNFFAMILSTLQMSNLICYDNLRLNFHTLLHLFKKNSSLGYVMKTFFN